MTMLQDNRVWARSAGYLSPWIRRLWGFGLAGVMLLGGLESVAAASQALPGESVESSDFEELKRLYNEGQARYDTFDYDGAVEIWTRVYAQLGDSATERQIKNAIVYNIASALEKAYDIDGDPKRLQRAIGLLDKYIEEFRALNDPSPDARKELTQAQERRSELQVKLAQAGGATVAPTGVTPTNTVSPKVSQAAAVRDLLRHDPEISRQYRSGRAMVISGAVGVGVGGLLFITGVAAIAYEQAADVDLETGESEGVSAASIAVTAVGGSLLVGSSVLLGIGSHRRRKAVRAAQAKVASQLSVFPSGSKHHAALNVRWRF